MAKKEQPFKTWVGTYLTPQQKLFLERRAQGLGMSVSAFLRTFITNPTRTTEEILAREWVSVALQLRQLQSGDGEKEEFQKILVQLKQLIHRTTSAREPDCKGG